MSDNSNPQSGGEATFRGLDYQKKLSHIYAQKQYQENRISKE